LLQLLNSGGEIFVWILFLFISQLHESLLSYHALLTDNKVYLQQVIFIIELI